MAPRSALLLLSLALFLGAGVAGFIPASVEPLQSPESVSCGSVLSPTDLESAGAIFGEDLATACDDERSTLRILTFGLAGFGVLALIVSFLASTSRTEEASRASWWR